MIFADKTFADCSLVQPMDTTPPNFVKKTSRFMQVFSLKSFSLYGTGLQHEVSVPVQQKQMQIKSIKLSSPVASKSRNLAMLKPCRNQSATGSKEED